LPKKNENDWYLMQCSDQSKIFTKCSYWTTSPMHPKNLILTPFMCHFLNLERVPYALQSTFIKIRNIFLLDPQIIYTTYIDISTRNYIIYCRNKDIFDFVTKFLKSKYKMNYIDVISKHTLVLNCFPFWFT